MARATHWDRFIGYDVATNLVDADRRKMWVKIADSVAGETLTRSIVTANLWLEQNPTTTNNKIHLFPTVLGLIGQATAFTTPTIDPWDNADNEAWVWWEYQPVDPTPDITFYNDDWLARVIWKFDTRAQREVKLGDGTPTDANWWIVVETLDNDQEVPIQGHAPWHLSVGSSLLFLDAV